MTLRGAWVRATRCASARDVCRLLRPGAKLRQGMVLAPLLALLATGCSTNQPVSSPSPSVQISTLPLQPPVVAPAPVRGYAVALATCCTATLPDHWTAPQSVDNTHLGSYDPSGRLFVTWQVVGSARTCPNQPPGLVDSLASPSHPSGDVIVGMDPFSVDGQHVTVYITAPRALTPRAYQFIDADAVFGANCVDLGGAEYGVASTANLATLLGILATTMSVSYPLQPSKTPSDLHRGWSDDAGKERTT